MIKYALIAILLCNGAAAQDTKYETPLHDVTILLPEGFEPVGAPDVGAGQMFVHEDAQSSIDFYVQEDILGGLIANQDPVFNETVAPGARYIAGSLTDDSFSFDFRDADGRLNWHYGKLGTDCDGRAIVATLRIRFLDGLPRYYEALRDPLRGSIVMGSCG